MVRGDFIGSQALGTTGGLPLEAGRKSVPEQLQRRRSGRGPSSHGSEQKEALGPVVGQQARPGDVEGGQSTAGQQGRQTGRRSQGLDYVWITSIAKKAHAIPS